MLFGANFPHPTFVDQAIGTHRQSGIPDMLEMLLVVQFIQIAISYHRSFSHCIMRYCALMRFYQPFPAAIPLYEAGYPRVTHPSATNFEKQALHRPFDLHVLSTPPAFILSQDQTLMFDFG